MLQDVARDEIFYFSHFSSFLKSELDITTVPSVYSCCLLCIKWKYSQYTISNSILQYKVVISITEKY